MFGGCLCGLWSPAGSRNTQGTGVVYPTRYHMECPMWYPMGCPIYPIYRMNGVAIRAPDLSIPPLCIEFRPGSNGQYLGPSNNCFHVVLGVLWVSHGYPMGYYIYPIYPVLGFSLCSFVMLFCGTKSDRLCASSGGPVARTWSMMDLLPVERGRLMFNGCPWWVSWDQ